MFKFLRCSLIILSPKIFGIWNLSLLLLAQRLFIVIVYCYWLSLFQVFRVELSSLHRTLFILSLGVDCSNFVNYEKVQMLNYTTCFFLYIPVIRIEPADDFTRKNFPTKRLILCLICLYLTMEKLLGIYKPNFFIHSRDIPLYNHIRFPYFY